MNPTIVLHKKIYFPPLHCSSAQYHKWDRALHRAIEIVNELYLANSATEVEGRGFSSTSAAPYLRQEQKSLTDPGTTETHALAII